MRAADLLMGSLDHLIEESGAIPTSLVDFVHEVLLTAYPPEPRNKVVSLWVLRSLQTMISTCPSELVMQLLEPLADGLCVWLIDDCNAFTSEEYSRDVRTADGLFIQHLTGLPS